MKKAKKKDESCCSLGAYDCKVESLVGVDERGQMVLPKELRDRAKIRAGDKLAVVTWEKNGEVCCISLLRVEDFLDMVKEKLGPMMSEIIAGNGGR